MNGVLGMIELLSHSGLNDRQRHFADNAHRAAKSLLDLLNDILDVSKIEAGKLELDIVEFEPRRLIEDTMVLFGEQARKKGLRLKREVNGSVPRLLHGDPVRLRQILSNLVSNAIKFTEEGEVSISLDASVRGLEDRLRFEVRDTGLGLSDENKVTIFDPFNQADGSDTRKYGGTGLGLTITRQLVDLMGGEVGVESQRGVGSTFWFEIPINGRARREDPTEEFQVARLLESDGGVAEQAFAAGRILLVEDNELNREVVGGMLEYLGGRADVATSGSEALDLVERGDYDLVLMDCQMPGMDGFEATERIRSLEAQSSQSGGKRPRVPIIAMTASALAGDRERCFEAGMDDYLGKPFTLDQLRDFLSRWLQLDEDSGSEEPRDRDVEAVMVSGVDVEQDVAEEDGQADPLDQKALDEIRTLEANGVAGLFDNIINIYLESSPELVAALRSAVEKRDASGLHAAAHSLKSTSASLGARYLASLCRELEAKGRSEDVESAAPVLDELMIEFERVTAALGRELRRKAV